MKIILTFLILFLLTSTSQEVYAQESSFIHLTPVRQELTLNPGETETFVLKLYSAHNQPLSGSLSATDFTVSPEGKPIIAEDSMPTRLSAKTWISVESQQITLPPKSTVSVPVSISVPLSAAAGEKYAALFFEPEAILNTDTDKTNVQVSSRIGLLISVRVPGETKEEAIISEFSAPSFQEYGPITVSTTLLNRSDYHIVPKGTLTLTDMFDRTLEQNSYVEVRIFPDSNRIYKQTVGKKWLIGKYRLKTLLTYGEKGQVLERSLDVWIIPWKIITAIILGLFIIVLLLRRFTSTQPSGYNKSKHSLREQISKRSD